MAFPQPQIVRVTVWELREIYNTGDYENRLARGELRPEMRERSHCKPENLPDDSPLCTHSEMLSLIDNELGEVARVHRYLRPDGTIAGSGRNDPKRVLRAGILYRIHKRGHGPAEVES